MPTELAEEAVINSNQHLFTVTDTVSENAVLTYHLSVPQEPGSPSSLLAHPPPPSLSPSPPRLTTHTPPHLPSPHSSTSPHTYTVSPNPLVPQTTSGPSPPPPEEPIRTTEDQRTSHEDRILALTQSALELKKKIAAEAERLKKARTKMPGHVSITVITATPPPSLTAPPTFDLSPQPDIGSLPGVGNVHRQARLTEEVRRQGEAATQIQALFRGHRVRRNHATSLGRVGDGEEDGIRTNGVLNTPSNGVLRTPASGVLKTVNTSSPSLPLKPAVPSHSVAVQTSTSELHLKPTTVAPTEVSVIQYVCVCTLLVIHTSPQQTQVDCLYY